MINRHVGPDAMDAADSRTRILDAAARLLAIGGVATLTTRAVAGHGRAAFIAQKVAAPPQPGPVQALRDARDAWVDFGMGHRRLPSWQVSACRKRGWRGLRTPAAERDPALSATAREAILAAVLNDTTASGPDGVSSFSVGLRAHLGETAVLSPGEALLLREMLDRIADRPG